MKNITCCVCGKTYPKAALEFQWLEICSIECKNEKRKKETNNKTNIHTGTIRANSLCGRMSKDVMWISEFVAKQAQLIFEKQIDSWPLAYGNATQLDIVPKSNSGDTHRCRIAFLELLEKEECQHQPIEHARIDMRGEVIIGFTYTCKHCGIELVADWKPRNTSEGCD